MSKVTSKKVLFSVDGFDVLEDTLYKVKQKKDPNAPIEMQEKGYSKYPGTGDTIKCPYSQQGKVYDAGFESSSRMYLQETTAQKNKIVKERRNAILLPYLQSQSLDEDRFRPSSTEDWDEFRVELNEDKVFRTNDVVSLMELYIALISRSIVPPNGEVYDYKYDGANFVLESSKIKTNAETENKLLKMEATSAFSKLIKDKDACIDIFVYLGFKELTNSSGDPEIMLRYFESKVLNTIAGIENFIEAVDKYNESDEGRAEIVINRIITKNLIAKNNDFGRDQGKVIFKNTVLGANEKESAKMLVENVNYSDTKSDIMFNYDNKKTK